MIMTALTMTGYHDYLEQLSFCENWICASVEGSVVPSSTVPFHAQVYSSKNISVKTIVFTSSIPGVGGIFFLTLAPFLLHLFSYKSLSLSR